MKTALIISAVAVSAAAAETAIPVAFDRERYEESLSQSPFALAAIQTDPTPPPPPSPLDTLVVTGLGKLDDGRTYVVLQQPGESLTTRLEGSESVNGLLVKQVKWADDWRHSTVTVTDGTKEKTLEFNKNSAPKVPRPPVDKGPNGDKRIRRR